ncbi:MAG TPA: hypothetical protein VIM40_10235, partial [Arthrobacter sp.]
MKLLRFVRYRKSGQSLIIRQGTPPLERTAPGSFIQAEVVGEDVPTAMEDGMSVAMTRGVLFVHS